MTARFVDRLSKAAFLRGLDGLSGGSLELVCPDGTRRFGTGAGLDARLVVSDERVFPRALLAGDIGLGEAYMDGDFSTPDLVTLARLMVRNLRVVTEQGGVIGAAGRLFGALARRLRVNSLAGSRRNIRHHYDLGNDFFRLFLDRDHMLYSSAYFESAEDSLEDAQAEKVDRICRRLDLKPSDHVLEIGTGWGGFAAWAATRYGCRVTTTTISREQHRYATERAACLGAAGARIDVRLEDYRELTGRYDKLVSIEMFEAVGLARYDDFFSAADRLLSPDGAMLLQTITVDDQWFPRYHGAPDWIEKHIFPGGELASLGEIAKSLARATSLSLYHAENFGTHYARTLHEWRARFHAALPEVRALGFDERFVRMWDLYLASCEAAFLERHTGVTQLLLVRNGTRARLFNEPWERAAAPPALAVARRA